MTGGPDLPDYLRAKWTADRDNELEHEIVKLYNALLELLDVHTQARSSVGPYCSACTPHRYRWPCETLRTLGAPYVVEDDYWPERWSL